MFLAPETHEIEIVDAAAAFLGDAIPVARLHGASAADLNPDARTQIGAMGWYGLALPEADGGSGLTAVEHTLFFREVGRLCGPVDLLAQCLAAHVADGGLRETLLAGKAGVALAA